MSTKKQIPETREIELQKEDFITIVYGKSKIKVIPSLVIAMEDLLCHPVCDQDPGSLKDDLLDLCEAFILDPDNIPLSSNLCANLRQLIRFYEWVQVKNLK